MSRKDNSVFISSLLMVMMRKLNEVLVNEKMFVIVVVMVNLNVIRLDVLFINVLFLSSLCMFLGRCICFVMVLMVIVLVGDRMVVRVKVVGSGIVGIS